MNREEALQQLTQERDDLFRKKMEAEDILVKSVDPVAKYQALTDFERLSYDILCIDEKITRLWAKTERKTSFWKKLFRK